MDLINPQTRGDRVGQAFAVGFALVYYAVVIVSVAAMLYFIAGHVLDLFG